MASLPNVAVVESDMANMDVKNFYDSIFIAAVGNSETAPVKAPIGLLVDSPEEVAEAKAKAAKSVPSPAVVSTSVTPPLPLAKFVSNALTKTLATSQVKKLAKQHNVDTVFRVGELGT
ncbi:hypothetical protein Fmac_018134 [Flemingia macrophylla]|uniref:Uncharacterized protein n=1 Tax=Flemingia macrophylla TaxID=520843 RepID=A0ABD1M451_9FABA